MRAVSLASGSSGNAILLDDDETRILVDCGIGPRTMATRLREAGVDPASVSAALLTHEHIDHMKGLAQAVAKWHWQVIGSAGTIRGLPAELRREATVVRERTRIGGLDVVLVPVAHDANEPTAYAITSRASGVRVGVAHDLGEPSDRLIRTLQGSQLLCIEANHCSTMLRNGPYPPYLQERVAGKTGHLSNDQCAALIDAVSSAELEAVLLLHLSAVNNTPTVACHAAKRGIHRRARKAYITAAIRNAVSPAIGAGLPSQLRLAI